MTKTTRSAIDDAVIIAICASILFVQQLALSFLPNIQFTIFLLVLFSKVLGFKKTAFIIVIHVLATNFLSPFGSVIPVLIPAMLIAYLLIPLTITTFLRPIQSALGLAMFGFVFGFVYGWIYIPFNVFFLNVPFVTYFMMDLPFEIIMGISNFIAILWLYEPLKKVFSDQYQRFKEH
ncbi:MAG: hypothetical protein IH571_03455 [Acholeplasmataceae bacterium]|nr:hypothetical protein [Acholeplasmataceae bacterium]